jgi:hypothetical protein
MHDTLRYDWLSIEIVCLHLKDLQLFTAVFVPSLYTLHRTFFPSFYTPRRTFLIAFQTFIQVRSVNLTRLLGDSSLATARTAVTFCPATGGC